MNPWMPPKKEQLRPAEAPSVEAPLSNEGATLSLHLGYDTLERVVKTACWRRFSNDYPLTMDAAANLIPEENANDALRQVRNLAATVAKRYFSGKTLSRQELRETVIELEAYMAAGVGIDCDLPGHERRDPNPPHNDDISSLRFPA